MVESLLKRGSSIYSLARESLMYISKSSQESCKFQTSLSLDYYERLSRKPEFKGSEATSAGSIYSIVQKSDIKTVITSTQELFKMNSSSEADKNTTIARLRAELKAFLLEKIKKQLSEEAKAPLYNIITASEAIVPLHLSFFYQICILDEPIDDEHYIKAILKIIRICKCLKANSSEQALSLDVSDLLMDLILMLLQKYQLLMLYFLDKNENYQYEIIGQDYLTEEEVNNLIEGHEPFVPFTVEEAIARLVTCAMEIYTKGNYSQISKTVKLFINYSYDYCRILLKLLFKLKYDIPSDDNDFLLNLINLRILKYLGAASQSGPVWEIFIQFEKGSDSNMLIDMSLTIIANFIMIDKTDDKAFLSLNLKNIVLSDNFDSPDAMAFEDSSLKFFSSRCGYETFEVISLIILKTLNGLWESLMDVATKFLIIILNKNLIKPEVFKILFEPDRKIAVTFIKSIFNSLSGDNLHKLLKAILVLSLQDGFLAEEKESILDMWKFTKNICQFDPEKTCKYLTLFSEALKEHVKIIVMRYTKASSEGEILSIGELCQTFSEFLQEVNLNILQDKEKDEILLNLIHFFTQIFPFVDRAERKSVVGAFDEIYTQSKLLERILIQDQLLEILFTKALNNSKSQDIFFHFINRFYSSIHLEEKSDKPLHRNLFFNKILKYFSFLKDSDYMESEEREFNVKKIFFFCVFFQKLIFQEPVEDFRNLFIGIQNCTHFEKLFSDQRHKEYADLIINLKLYESLLDILMNENFQKKEILFEILHLTYAIHFDEAYVRKKFQEYKYYVKLYKAICVVYKNKDISEWNVVCLLNMILNMATNAEFFFIMEKHLFAFAFDQAKKDQCSAAVSRTMLNSVSRRSVGASTLGASQRSLNMGDLLKNLKIDFQPLGSYINIQNPIYIEIIVRFLFEMKLPAQIKEFYLYLLTRILEQSTRNSYFLSKESSIVDRLLFFLRIERDLNIKRLIADFILSILRETLSIHQVRQIIRSLKPKLNCEEYLPTDTMTRDQLGDLLKDLNNLRNIQDSGSIILQILRQLTNSKPTANKFDGDAFHFSGQNSGIIIFNVDKFPINSFSVIFEVSFDNLLTMKKKSALYELYKRNLDYQRPQFTNRHTGLTPNKLNETEVAIDSMKPEMTVAISSEYQPRLLSIRSKKDNILEIYIDSSLEKNKKIVIETYRAKKDEHFIEIFEIPNDFKENVTYYIVITCNKDLEKEKQKQGAFDVLIDGNPLKKQRNTMFANSLKDFDELKYLTVGNHSPCSQSSKSEATRISSSENPKVNQCPFPHASIPQNYCFNGLLKSFYILPKYLNFTEIMEITSKYKLSTSRHHTHSNDKELRLDIRETANPIVDCCHFENLVKHEFSDDRSWIIISHPSEMGGMTYDYELQGKSSKLNFITKYFSSSNPTSETVVKKREATQRFEIKAKGVNLIQKSNFLDVFSSLGNVEVFFYLLDLLVTDKNMDLSDEESNRISCDIITLLANIIKENRIDYPDDSNSFFTKHHLYICQYLLNKLFAKHQCSLQLLEAIVNLTKSMSDFNEGDPVKEEYSYQAFVNLILNFELYSYASPGTQKALVAHIESFWGLPLITKKVKENQKKVEYLFYVLYTYYNTESALDPADVDSLGDCFIEVFQEIRQIRQTILDLIFKTIIYKPTENDLRNEITIVIKNITLCTEKSFGPSLIELLRLLIRIIKAPETKPFICNVMKTLNINLSHIVIHLLKSFKESNFEFLSWRSLCSQNVDSDEESNKQEDNFESACIEILEEVLMKKDTPVVQGRSQTIAGIPSLQALAKVSSNQGAPNFLEIHETMPIFSSLDKYLDKEFGPESAAALCHMIESSLEKGLDHKDIVLDMLMSRFEFLSLDSKMVILKCFYNFSKHESFLQSFLDLKELPEFFNKFYFKENKALLDTVEPKISTMKFHLEKLLVTCLNYYFEQRPEGMHKIESWMLSDSMSEKFQVIIKTLNEIFNREISCCTEESFSKKTNNDAFCINTLRLLGLFEYIVNCHPQEILVDLRLSVNFLERMVRYLTKFSLLYSTNPSLRLTRAQELRSPEFLWDYYVAGNFPENKFLLLNGGILGSVLRILNSVLSLLIDKIDKTNFKRRSKKFDGNFMRTDEQVKQEESEVNLEKADFETTLKCCKQVSQLIKCIFQLNVDESLDFSAADSKLLKLGSNPAELKRKTDNPNVKSSSSLEMMSPRGKISPHFGGSESFRAFRNLVLNSNDVLCSILKKSDKKLEPLFSSQQEQENSGENIENYLHDFEFYHIFSLIIKFYKKINIQSIDGSFDMNAAAVELPYISLRKNYSEQVNPISNTVEDNAIDYLKSGILTDMLNIVINIIKTSGQTIQKRLINFYDENNVEKYLKQSVSRRVAHFEKRKVSISLSNTNIASVENLREFCIKLKEKLKTPYKESSSKSKIEDETNITEAFFKGFFELNFYFDPKYKDQILKGYRSNEEFFMEILYKFEAEIMKTTLSTISSYMKRYRKISKFNNFVYDLKMNSLSILKNPVSEKLTLSNTNFKKVKIEIDKAYRLYENIQKICLERRKKYENQDLNNMMKLCKQWQSIKRNLQSDRGVWFEMFGKIIWKIDSFEDSLKRKLHIKEYIKGRDKEYLSNTAFHDKNYGRSFTKRFTKHMSKISIGGVAPQDPQLLRVISNDSPLRTVNSPRSHTQLLKKKTRGSMMHSYEDTSESIFGFNGANFSSSVVVTGQVEAENLKATEEEDEPNQLRSISHDPNQMKLRFNKLNRQVIFSEGDMAKFSKFELEEQIKDGDFNFDSNKIDNVLKTDLVIPAENIIEKGAIWGDITLTDKYFIFESHDNERPKDPKYRLGALEVNMIKCKKKKQWNFQSINEIHARSFNLRTCAFEIFTSDSKSYFFNVFQQDEMEKIITYVKKNNKDVNAIINRKECFEKSKCTEKWTQGEISNFEYLMRLNTFAGRTFNDINQYPVFPWILKNYDSKTLNLDSQDNYRDLSKPIGALDEERLKYFVERMECYVGADPKFHYGTHYSGAGNVMHFLIRLEPFTSLCLQLQSGKFDHPDRLFSSIPSAWNSCQTNTADVKELIPEFFYFPEFLKNRNKFDFGKKQTGEFVNDVILPNWASSPEEFIAKHRAALESDYVSENLHHWIDLIFGYKQTGKEAEKAHNLFYYLTYEGKMDLSKLDDDPEYQAALLAQISNYGQTPHQLMTTPHPAKDKPKMKPIIFNFKKLTVSTLLTKLDSRIVWVKKCQKNLKVLTSNHLLHKVPTDFLYYGVPNCQISKKRTETIGENSFNEYNPEFSISSSGNGGTLIISGYYDNSVHIFEDYKVTQIEMPYHKKQVTCVAYDEKREILICGSRDCRLSLINLRKKKTNEKSHKYLYGHRSEIVAIKCDPDLQIFLSVDKEGVCILHSLPRGGNLKTFSIILGEHESIAFVDLHALGLILIVTSENNFHLLNFNGERIKENNFKIERNKVIKQVRFFSKSKTDILVSTALGELFIIEAFSFEKKLEYDLTKKLNYDALTSIDVCENMQIILCGFSNGSVACIHANNEAAINFLQKNFKELGFS